MLEMLIKSAKKTKAAFVEGPSDFPDFALSRASRPSISVTRTPVIKQSMLYEAEQFIKQKVKYS
jgi:hypothetical protein